MAINISGFLKSPQGSILQNTELLFEQTRTTEEVLQGTKFSIVTKSNGQYQSTLGIGVFTLKVRFEQESSYRTVASNIIVTNAMDNYSINQIIQGQSQLQDVDYDLLQAVIQARDQQVQQQVDSSNYQAASKGHQDNSKTHQDNSQTSQQHSQASQADSQQSQSAQNTSQVNQNDSQVQAQHYQQQAAQSQASAKASEQQAQNSASQASTSAQQASQSKDQAKASEVQQKASEQSQSGSMQQASTSQSSAQASAQQAAQSQSAASSSQVNQANSAQAQQTSETKAAQSQQGAKQSETAASQSEQSALFSKDQQYSSSVIAETNKNSAKDWASKPEDQVVQEGLFSARHYAAKAANYAQTQLGQLIWRGGWSAQQGTTPPTPQTSTQDFYRITAQGTILGVSYDIGDYIHWDTINSIWFKMDGTDSVVSVNGDTGQVVLTQDKVGAVTKHEWIAKVKLGSWSAIGQFNHRGYGGKAVVTVGMTRGNFVSNARFLISWGHPQVASIIQLESHNYSQIKVRVGTVPGDNCIFSILDTDYGTTVEGTEVNYFCQVDELFGSLQPFTSFTSDEGIITVKETVTTEWKSLKLGNNKVYHQGFVPTAREVGAVSLSGDTMLGALKAVIGVKGAVQLEDKASIRFIDLNNTWFHNYSEGNLLRWSTGLNGEIPIAYLDANGKFGATSITSHGNGIAFSGTGGSITSQPTFLSLNGNSYSFVTAPNDVHLCYNAKWDGANWTKYDDSRDSGMVVVNTGGLQYNTSLAGSTSPHQFRYDIYHEGRKPQPAEIGALSLGGGSMHEKGEIHYPQSNSSMLSRDNQWVSLEGGTHVAITTGRGNPGGAAYIGKNFYFDGGWKKFHNNNGSGMLEVSDVGLTYFQSDSGQDNPIQRFYKVYHEGNKPSASELQVVPIHNAGRSNAASASALKVFSIHGVAGAGSATFSFLLSGGNNFGRKTVPVYKISMNNRGDSGSGAVDPEYVKVTSLEGSEPSELGFYLYRNTGGGLDLWVTRPNYSSQISVIPLSMDSSGTSASFPMQTFAALPDTEGIQIPLSISFTSSRPPTTMEIGAVKRGHLPSGSNIDTLHGPETAGLWGIMGGDTTGWPWSNISAGSLLVETVNHDTHQTASRAGSMDTMKRWCNPATGVWSPWSPVYNGVSRPAVSNWAGFSEVPQNVSGCLLWRNYGNSHVIFDASASVSPTGEAVDRINSQIPWTPAYPTLMGWNGNTTYGVRVDTARLSELVQAIPGQKSAIDVPNGASIRFRDGSGAWMHQYAVGSTITWGQGTSADIFMASLSSGGNFTTTGYQTGTAHIAQSSNSSSWLGIEALPSGDPYISFKGQGMSDVVKGISFGDKEFYSHRTLSSELFRVGANAGLRFSPNSDLSGNTWGIGINPENRNIGFHVYLDGAWQRSPLIIQANGVAQFAGPVSTGGNTTIGGGLVTSGDANINGGYLRIQKSSNPMTEWHALGKHAVVQYVPDAGGLTIASSNGVGVPGLPIVKFGTGSNYFTGNIGVSNPQLRGWTDMGVAALHNFQAQVSHQALTGLATGRYHFPGVYDAEMGLGALHNSNVEYASHTLFTVAGGGYLKAWNFYNSGKLTDPSGQWLVESNGFIWGTGYGNQYLHQWATARFAPISDRRLKRNIRPTSKSALEDISKIDFVSYEWDSNNPLTKGKKSVKVGVTAQQLEDIDPCYASDTETYEQDGKTVASCIKVIDTTNVLALALKAIQEQSEQIQALKAEVDNLKQRFK